MSKPHSSPRPTTKRKKGRGSAGGSRVAETNPPEIAQPGIHRHRTYAGLSILALLLTSLVFAPLGVWPAAFLCLVPWTIMVAMGDRPRRVYAYTYLYAVAFFFINMRWLTFATVEGYIALSLYIAVYFLLAACVVRHAARRRHLPLALVLPVVWVGTEMLRAVVITGFPWFFLAHGFHKILTLIQISDLVGAYGVSFVAAAVNGAVADYLLARIHRQDGETPGIRRCLPGVIFAALLLALSIGYGQYQLRRQTISTGPRIAILQGDFISRVEGGDASETEKLEIYRDMMQAVAGDKPDLVLLPESPWYMFLNPEARDLSKFSQISFDILRSYATIHDACIVTGCGRRLERDDLGSLTLERYNSAAVFHPDRDEPEFYDKVHLVPFGEYVPFRNTRFHWLYLRLNNLMPFSGPDNEEFSYFLGKAFHRYEMHAPSLGGEAFWFGIPICYEDVMPYVARAFTSGGEPTKQVDFLLNISNDGWFGRGHQQPQHLAICCFRAVENRVGIARAVNTGISAFITPNGQVYDRVKADPANPWPRACNYAVANVLVDSRYSLYSRTGDWFAWSCVFLAGLLFLDAQQRWIRERIRRRRAKHAEVA